MFKFLLCMIWLQLFAVVSSDFSFERRLQGNGDSGRPGSGKGGSGRRRGGNRDDDNASIGDADGESGRRRRGNRDDDNTSIGDADGESARHRGENRNDATIDEDNSGNSNMLTNITNMIGADASQVLTSDSRADMGVTPRAEKQGRDEAGNTETAREENGMSTLPLVPVVAAAGSVFGLCLCLGVWRLCCRKGAQKAETQTCSAGRYVEAVETTSTIVVGNPVSGDIESQEKAVDGEPCKKHIIA